MEKKTMEQYLSVPQGNKNQYLFQNNKLSNLLMVDQCKIWQNALKMNIKGAMIIND